ncbi:MAG: 1-acyl-sn-glycerol-3-phosphate acyltransferase [Rhodobacterales bacterium]|nr:1-acyl-sn-glycerol-3-phosphate acyltransferase [Rhodobacterales bacterium]
MPMPLRWIVSLLFSLQIYLVMGLMALWFTPWAAVDRRGAYAAVRTWCRWVRWSARVMLGLRTEVRGQIPRGEVLIAAKHQSFLDIILIVSEVPRPKFIMKSELKWAPILGWYALRIGCVPVDRGKRGQAIAQMKEGVRKGQALPGQLIIYPEGTRTAPGARPAYKIGTGVLYDQLGQTCVPAATNVGIFWPRRGVLRKPGVAVVEFLAPIQPGMNTGAFMAELERRIEGATGRLLAEGGFTR